MQDLGYQAAELIVQSVEPLKSLVHVRFVERVLISEFESNAFNFDIKKQSVIMLLFIVVNNSLL
jgi:hypothetical protein